MKHYLFKWIVVVLFLLVAKTGYSQSATVSGTVSDNTGALPGVSIYTADKLASTTTDIDGNFTIDVKDASGKKLVFSFVGYATQIIELNGSNQILNINLKEDAQNLDEVLVVGSTVTQSRKELGNAITTVKAGLLLKADPVGTISALQGKVPGALITQNSGDPAGGFTIRLRGPSTIKGTSDPLYVIDGVVTSNLTTNVTNINVSAGQASPGQNRMIDINPNDIANINIINGSAAAAIYGSRASNGVVLITTKKGINTDDGPELYFKTSFNMNTIREKLDLNLTGEEFETIPNSSLTGRLWPIFGFDPDGGLTPFRYLSEDKFSNTRYDYQDDIFDTGYGTDNYFSMRGGNDKIGYSASVGYMVNEGIVKNTKYTRLTGRLNFTHEINSWIKYDVGLYFSDSRSDEKPDGNVFWSPVNSMNITNNTFDISQRDANGDLMAVERTRVNPLSIIETFDINQKVKRFIPNLHLSLSPTEHLTIDQIIAMDTYEQKGHIFIPIYPYENVNPAYFDKGYLGDATADVFNWNYDITATYDIDINEKLNSKTTAGYNFQSSELKYHATQGRDLDASDVPTVPLQTIQSQQNLDIYGVFLQETLSYDDRLFFTIAGRIDGATNFDVDNRTNFYPKISGSYVLSNEDFWNDSGFFNSVRFRASYGEAGNLTAIGPYERYGSYTTQDFLGQETLQQNSRLGNDELNPERTKEYELGVDLSFWNNRAGLLFTYYNQNIEDLIVGRVVAPSIGGSSRTENVGSMKNDGIEIYARVTPVKTDKWVWNLDFNYSKNTNKVIETIGGDITVANSTGAPVVVKEGEPLGVFYGTYYARDDSGDFVLTGPSTDGVPVGVPQVERGDLATGLPMRDAAGQPTGDVLRQVIGNPNPDYIVGIGNDLTYKNFTFYMLWEAVQGFDVFDADKRTRQGVGLGSIAKQELMGELPRGYIAGIYPIQEFRMEDGSFVKMREISLSYNIPSLWNDNLQNFKISLIGRNLISIDNFFSYDPETNAGGQSNLLRAVNFGNVPIPQSYAISLSANF